MEKYYRKIEKHFSKYPLYNSVVHLIAGVGVGILIARPFAGTHPTRWGIALITISVLGHLKPLLMKK